MRILPLVAASLSDRIPRAVPEDVQAAALRHRAWIQSLSRLLEGPRSLLRKQGGVLEVECSLYQPAAKRVARLLQQLAMHQCSCQALVARMLANYGFVPYSRHQHHLKRRCRLSDA